MCSGLSGDSGFNAMQETELAMLQMVQKLKMMHK